MGRRDNWTPERRRKERLTDAVTYASRNGFVCIPEKMLDDEAAIRQAINAYKSEKVNG